MAGDDRAYAAATAAVAEIQRQTSNGINDQLAREAVSAGELAAAPHVSFASKLSKPDEIRVDRGDYVRVSGDVTCKVCGLEYRQHDEVVGAEFLRRACDGRLLKL